MARSAPPGSIWLSRKVLPRRLDFSVPLVPWRAVSCPVGLWCNSSATGRRENHLAERFSQLLQVIPVATCCKESHVSSGVSVESDTPRLQQCKVPDNLHRGLFLWEQPRSIDTVQTKRRLCSLVLLKALSSRMLPRPLSSNQTPSRTHNFKPRYLGRKN